MIGRQRKLGEAFLERRSATFGKDTPFAAFFRLRTFRAFQRRSLGWDCVHMTTLCTISCFDYVLLLAASYFSCVALSIMSFYGGLGILYCSRSNPFSQDYRAFSHRSISRVMFEWSLPRRRRDGRRGGESRPMDARRHGLRRCTDTTLAGRLVMHCHDCGGAV